MTRVVSHDYRGCERTLLLLTETRFKTHAKHSLGKPPEKPPTTTSLSSFRERQDNTSRAIPCSHPHNYKDRIPAVLLHSVFDRLIEDRKNVIMELADAMSALYSTESTWIDMLSWKPSMVTLLTPKPRALDMKRVRTSLWMVVVTLSQNLRAKLRRTIFSVYRLLPGVVEKGSARIDKFSTATFSSNALSVCFSAPNIGRCRSLHCLCWCHMESPSNSTITVDSHCIYIPFIRPTPTI